MKRSIVTGVIIVVVAVIAFFIGCKTSNEKPEQKNLEKTVTVTFPGAEKHEISLAEAKTFIQNHQKSLLAQKSNGPQIKAETFERGAIEKILAQPGCAQLRIYYGRNADGKPSLLLVGVDSASTDMTKGMSMERGSNCPPFCGATSELLK
jgi:hypothetical protein